MDTYDHEYFKNSLRRDIMKFFDQSRSDVEIHAGMGNTQYKNGCWEHVCNNYQRVWEYDRKEDIKKELQKINIHKDVTDHVIMEYIE